ncbi:centriole, cilia and spindle-associated protein [Ictalurus punctatus]|uniref:Centriole, cilia and spindle-associated protein n=1 Tax=Ictalurus punctatus TaxID=7998 RepID=A0A2D0QNV0_ICTPU|nr:centriole, cilia and spindle-associated protein [Ictalurus punctatus]XP_053535753.1 centriole, cilia and spindle-associated protein [Ictalurus punctatus]XP_053535754.1 centriole, cilia and spindle-associated protein [Ictalurus punctatus]XP_053535755.1 centriole, cilia and spindle-associated protein [Ictalurus punctatus]
MVTKRIRSEYMKKFKDPKWETYAKCYEDLVNYRLSRRMLEQTHNPWFWDECKSDTESSGKCTPQERTEDYRLQKEENAKETAETVVHEVYGAEEEREPDTSQVREQVTEDVKTQAKEEEKGTVLSLVAPVIPKEKYPCVQSNTKSKPRHSYKPTRTKAKHHITIDVDKENRHPFAMYGSGEKQADMASKRTHNVGPASSTKEIHESALRAKNRREVEKQMKRMDKRRAKSADLEKLNKSKIVPDYNPWMTEYMRCFSARSQ